MSGPLPVVRQHCTPVPALRTNLIDEHVIGVNEVLQPFVIGSPLHALPVATIVPTFVVSQ